MERALHSQAMPSRLATQPSTMPPMRLTGALTSNSTSARTATAKATLIATYQRQEVIIMPVRIPNSGTVWVSIPSRYRRFGVAPGGERVLHYLLRSSALFACYPTANMDVVRDKWCGLRGYRHEDGGARFRIFSPLLYRLSYLGKMMGGNDLQRFWSRSANRRVQSWYVVPFSNIKVGYDHNILEGS